MSLTNYSRYKYTPDEMSQKEFLSRFVVRDDAFDELLEDIMQSDYSVPTQHTIIIGQRGQGKTTLLRRIQIEIENDPHLSQILLAVKFAEEQYQIRSLCRLWEEIADYLQSLHADIFPAILDTMETYIEDDNYELQCFSYLEKALKAQNKKLVLLIDNIDELLGKLKEKEQRQLREILLTSSSFKIIGGSTKMLEQHFDYGKPFYEFFTLIKLQGLNKEESIKFLLSIGTEEQKAKMQIVVDTTPQRIETLRRLTGGVPRTLVMLFDIFIDDGGNAFDDLLKVLDEATPLYKHRMDDLPPMLQDIVHTIAMNWDGMMTKEIAKKTRLESKVVSAQLKQLTDKYQIIEAESIGKNKIYKIQERFFNIWYLMRFGRKKDRQRVEWLVKFLVSWCTPDELEERANKFTLAIQNGQVNENYAFAMCEALGYAGLNEDTEHTMKESVKNLLNDIGSSLAKDISPSDMEIVEEAYLLINRNKLENAITLLVKSKKSSKDILFTLGWLYGKHKEYKKAEEYYLKVIEYGDNKPLNNLGVLYYEQKEYEKAKDYYLKAIESGDNKAFRNLGNLYYEQKEYEKTKEYYLKAIENKDNKALNSLGNLYCEQKEYEKAKEYYLKAIENKDNKALNSLGNLYCEQKEYEKAKEYYLKAIESEDNKALHNLGLVYYKQKKYEKAEEYYLKAIENGDYFTLKNIGQLYKDRKEYSKAEEYYLKAIESGDNGENNNVLNNLSLLYFIQYNNVRKALSFAKKSYDIQKSIYSTYPLAVILLWNETFNNSYQKFLELLDYNTTLNFDQYIALYLNLLISKGQYYKAKEFLEMPEYQLQERYKSIWYALMTLMQDDFPHEIKKMGSELEESVDEVLLEIERLEVKYALD